MPQPLTVALPPGLVLGGGYTITLTALDPATGDDVTDVQVQNVHFQVDLLSGAPSQLLPVLLIREGVR